MNIDQEIKKIKSEPGGWYNKCFDGWFHFMWAAGTGAMEVAAKRLPVYNRWGIWILKKHSYDWFWSKAGMKKTCDWLIRNNRDNLKHFTKLQKTWRQDWNRFQKNRRWFLTHDWKKLSDKQLASRYRSLYNSYIWCNSIPYAADSFLTSGEEDIVSQKLVNTLEDKIASVRLPEVINDLTAPVYDSFINRSHKSLLQLALLVSRDQKLKRTLLTKKPSDVLSEIDRRPKLKKLIKQHIKNYSWIHNNYYEVKYLDERYVLSEAKKMIKGGINLSQELKKEKTLHKNNLMRKNILMKKVGLAQDLRNLIHLSEKITRWQDDRKSAVYQVNQIMFAVVEEVGRRAKLPWSDVAMTTLDELIAALVNRKYLRKLWRARYQRAIAVHKKGESVIISGQKANKLTLDDFMVNRKGLKEFSGICASPGLVQGKVRIANNTKAVRSVKSGEVLVANNTTPDYVPAMKKSAAIITEQGGITGHAAIVSRELGTPCVVGVEGITKVLKTGQLVKVDATKGIITLK